MVLTELQVFWDVMPCWLVNTFARPCWLYLLCLNSPRRVAAQVTWVHNIGNVSSGSELMRVVFLCSGQGLSCQLTWSHIPEDLYLQVMNGYSTPPMCHINCLWMAEQFKGIAWWSFSLAIDCSISIVAMNASSCARGSLCRKTLEYCFCCMRTDHTFNCQPLYSVFFNAHFTPDLTSAVLIH